MTLTLGTLAQRGLYTEVEACGYPAIMVLMPRGYLTGFVGIPKQHPWHGKQRHETVRVPQKVVQRHLELGRISTFDAWAGKSRGNPPEGVMPVALALDIHGGISYVSDKNPAKGHADGFWWFGFSCNQFGDAETPYEQTDTRIYRDEDYVMAEIVSLANQLRAVQQ